MKNSKKDASLVVTSSTSSSKNDFGAGHPLDNIDGTSLDVHDKPEIGMETRRTRSMKKGDVGQQKVTITVEELTKLVDERVQIALEQHTMTLKQHVLWKDFEERLTQLSQPNQSKKKIVKPPTHIHGSIFPIEKSRTSSEDGSNILSEQVSPIVQKVTLPPLATTVAQKVVDKLRSK